jgi:hypothetical protein
MDINKILEQGEKEFNKKCPNIYASVRPGEIEKEDFKPNIIDWHRQEQHKLLTGRKLYK